MTFNITDVPKVEEPITYSYKVSPQNREEYERRKKRANEIGIHLFVLDEDDSSNELKELEQYIIDNYINMDRDIPLDIKKKYLELKDSEKIT